MLQVYEAVVRVSKKAEKIQKENREREKARRQEERRQEAEKIQENRENQERKKAIRQNLSRDMIGILKTTTTDSSIDNSSEMTAARNLKELYGKPDFAKEFITQVRTVCPDIVKTIPDFEKALNALVHIPLTRFAHPKEVLTYTEALIESGTAAQADQGLVFVIGNTNTGKTSLVNTFKDFVTHPSDKPCSVLTKPDDNLIETQVLEVYDGLSLNQEGTFEVDRTSLRPVLVNLKEVKRTVTKTEFIKHQFHKITTLLTGSAEVVNNNNPGLQLKIVDLGNSNHLRK